MGHMYYGNDPDPILMPDRVLAHLKVVIATKLRRQESFTISWRHAAGEVGGRSTLWMHPAIPIRFVFDAAQPEALDHDLLQRLATEAGSTSGLMVDFEAFAQEREPELALAGTAA